METVDSNLEFCVGHVNRWVWKGSGEAWAVLLSCRTLVQTLVGFFWDFLWPKKSLFDGHILEICNTERKRRIFHEHIFGNLFCSARWLRAAHKISSVCAVCVHLGYILQFC